MTEFHETGKDMNPDTGEHVHHGALDFDAWAYLRVGSGYTICVRQVPPQPVLDALGDPSAPPNFWTVNIGGNPPFVTYLPFCEADDDAPRIPYDSLPDDVKEIVVSSAGSGWVWGGEEHAYDLSRNEWVVVPKGV